MYIANGALLRMGGFSTSMDGLNGVSGATIDRQRAAPVTLTVGANGGSGSFGGLIENTGGSLSFTKVGAGAETLTGTPNTYSGEPPSAAACCR